MKKTLDGLRAKKIFYLTVTNLPMSRYGIEQIKVHDQHLIAIPDEYLLELIGESLLAEVMRCSKKCLNSLSLECKIAGDCQIAFDTQKNTVEVYYPNGNIQFVAYRE